MKIIVAVKRVIDYNVQVRVKADGTGVEKENVKKWTQPWHNHNDSKPKTTTNYNFQNRKQAP